MTNVTKNLIGDRYSFTGTSALKLTDLQIKKRDIVKNNLLDGVYEQELLLCPICDGDSFELIAEQDRFGLPVSTVICNACDLVQTNPRMREQDYSDFYAHHYRELYRGYKQANNKAYQDAKTKAEGVFAYIRKTIGESKAPLSVLDVGCGSGALLEVFQNAGGKATGIDYGEDFQNLGKEKGLDLRQATIFDLDDSIQPDLIIYNHVFEHVLDLNKELHQVASILGDGGYLYIQVPGLKDLGSNYGSDFLRSLQNAHLYHFTLSTLNHLMMKNGFTLVRGNEYIHSLWQKNDNKAVASPEVNSPKESYEIIKKAEKQRVVYGLTKSALKKVGIFDFSKKLAKKIMSRAAR